MKIVKVLLVLFLVFLSALFLYSLKETLVAPSFPRCTKDLSLYDKAKDLGEVPFGGGVETSKWAQQVGGLGLGLVINPKNGNWRFITTDTAQKTCWVAAGKNWKRMATEVPWEIVIGGAQKRMGYCASFAQVSKELAAEGKMESGFGDIDADFSGTDIVSMTSHFFNDSAGSFAAVTDVTYRSPDGSSFSFSCIDSTGIGWKFEDAYKEYKNKP